MPLFHVQDSDRPMWVIAPSFAEALDKWAKVVAEENDFTEDAGLYLAENPPNGIAHICNDHELLP
jgi:hypothetical protein